MSTTHNCTCKDQMRDIQQEHHRLKQVVMLMAENIEDGSPAHALALAQMAVVDQIINRGDR